MNAKARALAVAWVLAAGPARAQPAPPPAEPPAQDAAANPRAPLQVVPEADEAAVARVFSDELKTLSPARVEAYLDLAERVSDEGLDKGHATLATRLCVLAYEMDRRRSPRPALAASACLQIASLTGSTRDRQWLASLARAIDPRQAPAGWVEQAEAATSDSGSYRLAVLLGQLRTGDGIPARRLLGDPEIVGMVTQYEGLMRRTRVSSGLWEMQREAERWPCRECGNQRSVKRVQAGVVEWRICPVCRGRPGADLTGDELVVQLRFETWLLQGSQRSWAAQLGVDEGATLVDPDPGELARVFAIDPYCCVWRDGRWVEDPAFGRPAPPAAPGANPAGASEGPAAPPSGS